MPMSSLAGSRRLYGREEFMSELLLKRMDDGMLVLTLNRPEQLNALTWELMRLLQEALE
jgi:enoyl-CoA hydratase/carnithine racemase